MKPHKVKIVSGHQGNYSLLAVCEYCGKVAFYGNNEAKQTDNITGLGDCPNSPDSTALLGTEFLSMISRIGSTSSGVSS